MINRLAQPRQSHNGGKRMPSQQVPSAPATRWTHSLESFIGEHPVATLAAAVSVGVLVGWLVKRH